LELVPWRHARQRRREHRREKTATFVPIRDNLGTIAGSLVTFAGRLFPLQRGGKAQTILVVDDEELVLNLCSRILAHAAYKVLTAINGQHEVDIARSYKHSIEVALN
jgi:PleD family two-component response regulator